MGQHEIYALLKNNPNKKYTSKELAQQLNINTGSINASLIKLRRNKNIKTTKRKKITNRAHIIYQYQYKKEAQNDKRKI